MVGVLCVLVSFVLQIEMGTCRVQGWDAGEQGSIPGQSQQPTHLLCIAMVLKGYIH